MATALEHATTLCGTLIEAATIRTLISFNVFTAIPSKGSISLQDLANSTHVQASLLERLLRVVVGSSFVLRNDDGTYSHTPLSLGYAAMGDMYIAIFDELSCLVALPEYFQQKGAKEPEGDQAATHNPSTWHAGQEGKTTFEILEQEPEKAKRAMKLMSQVEHLRPYTGFYDYGNLARGAGDRLALVDVGGGNGTTLAKILEAHPNIKPEQCMLQDRKAVVDAAKQSGDLPSGLQFDVYNFFEPELVKGARAYQLRAVCHDWSDSVVINILKNIAGAMEPDSKLLIADNVLPETGVKGFAAVMDMMMLAIGGKERTKANFEAVLDAAGLKLDAVYSAQIDTYFAIVEASLK